MNNIIECSACKPGEERWELFKSHIGSLYKGLYLYDYRARDGALFSIVDTSLENARKERDEWLEKKVYAMKGRHHDNDSAISTIELTK